MIDVLVGMSLATLGFVALLKLGFEVVEVSDAAKRQFLAEQALSGFSALQDMASHGPSVGASDCNLSDPSIVRWIQSIDEWLYPQVGALEFCVWDGVVGFVAPESGCLERSEVIAEVSC